MQHRMADGSLRLCHGPIQMAIWARRHGVADPGAAEEIAAEVMAEFQRVAVHMERLREMRAFREPSPLLPVALNKMIAAVEASGDPDLNTLAAVAGAFAEYAVEIGEELGCTRVVVDNGGDIALFNQEETPIRVGIPCHDGLRTISIAPGSPVRGVCTSGRGGRSFSRGIASGVSVLASSASLADACATSVANATDVEDPAILRCLAEEIDEGTDIRGRRVTLKVGPLSRRQRQQAVEYGADHARGLLERGVILGAVIRLDEIVTDIPEGLLSLRKGG